MLLIIFRANRAKYVVPRSIVKSCCKYGNSYKRISVGLLRQDMLSLSVRPLK